MQVQNQRRLLKNAQIMSNLLVPYMIVCKQTQLSLKVANPMDAVDSKIIACQPDINDLSQIWFKSIGRGDMDEITNASTGLVMEVDDGIVCLRRGKLKQSQMFYMSKYRNLKQPNDNSFVIKPVSKGSTQALCQYGALMVKEYVNNNENFIFEWRLADFSTPIVNSCVLKNEHSNHVVDIPESSFDPGKVLIQYSPHGKLNQRWIFISNGDNKFKIRSLNNGLVMDLQPGGKKLGCKIIQNQQTDQNSQLWSLQKTLHGFLIMSCISQGFYLGIQHQSTNLGAQLQLVLQNNSSNIWSLLGKEPS